VASRSPRTRSQWGASCQLSAPGDVGRPLPWTKKSLLHQVLVSRSVTTWYRELVADHYTLRLAPGVRRRLSEWARRAGIQERTLAQRYVEEGLRHDAHPLVRDNNGSMAEAAEYLQIPAGLVEAAVAYYGEYRDEIDREVELNEAEYERGRAAAAAGEQALRS